MKAYSPPLHDVKRTTRDDVLANSSNGKVINHVAHREIPPRTPVHVRGGNSIGYGSTRLGSGIGSR